MQRRHIDLSIISQLLVLVDLPLELQGHDALKLRSTSCILNDIIAEHFTIAVEFFDCAIAELVRLLEVFFGKCREFTDLIAGLCIPLLNRHFLLGVP